MIFNKIVICLLLTTITAYSQTVPNYISSMPAYAVRALSGAYAPTNGKTVITQVTPPEYTPPQGNGVYPLFAAWSGGGAAYSGYVLNVHGGGHGDSSLNGMYFYDFSGTNAPTGWTQGAVSFQSAVCSDCVQYADGKPTSVHTYFGMITVGDRIYRFGGVPFGSGTIGTSVGSWRYSRSSASWTRLADIGIQWPLVIYSPAANKIAIGGAGNQVRFLNLATEQFGAIKTNSGSGGTVWDPYSCSAWDTTRNRGIFTRAQNTNPAALVNIDWSAETTSTSLLNATGQTAGLAASASCFYDPVRDSYWFFGGGGQSGSASLWDSLYEMNASTFVMTKTSLTGDVIQLRDLSYGSYGRFVFMPEARAIGIASGENFPAYVIKLPGTGTPPPPDTTVPSVPTNLSAVAFSSSQINLSWTASTDNVGVSAYRIERCQGASCGSFAEIATPSASAYSNTGLAASTSYSYRVRATDAAGNLSGYSGIATATTPASIPPPSGTLQVGVGKPYATVCAAIAAASSGSTIEIDAGIYSNESCSVDQSLTLKGIGGLAHMKWGTGDYRTNTSNIPNGKGLLIINATTSIDAMEFSGARVADDNGAGIRYQSGDLTIRHSYFHGNQDGILGEGGLSATATLEYNVFSQNGYCPSNCGHNLYIGTMGKLIFRFNKSTDSLDGSHTLKSRAYVNEVISNFLSTKNSDGSYEADFPNGGQVYFIGNVVEQGANTGNSSILAYGAEGATNPNPFLAVGNNTFFNYRGSGIFVQVSGTPSVSIKNNIFANGGTFLSGATADTTSNKPGASGDFVDAAQGNYHLAATSTSINAGVAPGTLNNYNLTPEFEYVEPAGSIMRMLVGTIDVGAHESGVVAPPTDPCAGDPLQFSVSRWPTGTSGAKSINYSTNRAVKIVLDMLTIPFKATATDANNCTVMIVKP